MKTSLFKTAILAALLVATSFIIIGCETDDDIVNPVVLPTTITEYDEVLGWTATDDENAQDVFDIEFVEGSVVNFSATAVTGGSVLQVALYAPGVSLGGANLFTGDNTELRCGYVDGCNNNTAGQTVSGFTVATAGIYRLAITRHYGSSCGSEGTYRLQVTSATAFSELDQTVEDAASLAEDWSCPGGSITGFDDVFGWTSPVGVNTQDVFDINFPNGAVVNFAATEVTGGSVLQMALYAPDVALGGNNLFTGSDAELLCGHNPNCSDNTEGQTVTAFTIAAAGTYRLAITRNYGLSCGTDGTYHLQVTSDTGFAEPEQTVEDEESLATDADCPAEMTQAYDQVHGWTAEVGVSVQDVFDFDFADGAVVNFSATEVTGSSVLQMALYAPDVALGGNNLFTGSDAELLCGHNANCNDNTAGQTVTAFTISGAGTYRLAITRNYGSSCGTDGTYRLQVTSGMDFAEPDQTVDDVATLATTTDCPEEMIQAYDEVHGWASKVVFNPQDVFDIDFTQGSVVSFLATEVTGDSVLQLALYAPGVALGGNNLFTGTDAELLCGHNANCSDNTDGQTVSEFAIPTTGTYRVAITRNHGLSCGTDGTYRLQITSGTDFSPLTQTVDDAASLASGTYCPAEMTESYDQVSGWTGEIGVDPQDVYDIDFAQGTVVSFSATEVTGDSVLQMALYAPGESLGGLNLFTYTEAELRCGYVSGCSNNTAGQTVDNLTIMEPGTYRLAITRSFGSSCSLDGTYRLQVSADGLFSIPVLTADDVESQATEWQCPDEQLLSYSFVYDCSSSPGVNEQDVFNIDLNAGAVIDISLTEVTGESSMQMALYGPGIPLGGLNLLTGSNSELFCGDSSNCSNNTEGPTVTSHTIEATGTYRIAVTRNHGYSCGTVGTFRLNIQSDADFYAPTQTADGIESMATSWNCDVASVLEFDEVFGWACATGEDCQDVFEIYFTAGTSVDIRAGEVTGDSLLQMALYAPGTSLGGINLLTGTNEEFRCSYVDGCSNNIIGQTVYGFDILEDGIYQLAITRNWGYSCGGSGTYRLHLVADSVMTDITQTVEDVDSAAIGWTCPD